LAAKILTVFSSGDFGNGSIQHDVGVIIESETKKICSILGSYDEMAKIPSK
jgi:hypothetical protein